MTCPWCRGSLADGAHRLTTASNAGSIPPVVEVGATDLVTVECPALIAWWEMAIGGEDHQG